jgi:hypothetical protein
MEGMVREGMKISLIEFGGEIYNYTGWKSFLLMTD